jgi:hypothetical protein
MWKVRFCQNKSLISFGPDQVLQLALTKPPVPVPPV